jgi:formyltetrahydrofolate synthetase
MNSYKPSPQMRYLVEKMTDSEKTLLEAITKLFEKMDIYDKRITSMGSDLSKVQSQVDLSMRSIQALEKEQVLLVQMIHSGGPAGPSRSQVTAGVMGPSPTVSASTTASPVPPHPVPPPSH